MSPEARGCPQPCNMGTLPTRGWGVLQGCNQVPKRLAHSRCSRNGRFHCYAQLDSRFGTPYEIFKDARGLQAHSTLLKSNLRVIKKKTQPHPTQTAKCGGSDEANKRESSTLLSGLRTRKCNIVAKEPARQNSRSTCEMLPCNLLSLVT